MPICGVLDVGWAYKYLGIPLDDKPWFQMKIAKLHSLVQKWIVEFESVGLSFFKEMNDYEKVEKALDIFNVSGWAPFCRVDRGTYFAWNLFILFEYIRQAGNAGVVRFVPGENQ